MPESHKPWRVLESVVLIDTPHLRLRRDRVETPRWELVEDYHVRETRGFVVIFAVTPAGEVVLVRQYKHGIGAVVLELPAGAIDAGETALGAAVRELEEETGYTAAQGLTEVRSFVIDPTNSNGRFTLFYGTGAVATAAPRFDSTEDIAVELIPLDRLLDTVRDGAIDVGSHVASIYTVLDWLGRV